MASLFNTRISDTYSGLIKTIDNAALTSSLKELTDGSGLASGVFMNTAGDFKVTAILEFGSLKDTVKYNYKQVCRCCRWRFKQR